MKHTSHKNIVARVKRAHGHLASIAAMFDENRPCVDIAQQLQAVESAIRNAKVELINDHIEHCLAEMERTDAVREFKTLSKYL